jgi:hypothetical protein
MTKDRGVREKVFFLPLCDGLKPEKKKKPELNRSGFRYITSSLLDLLIVVDFFELDLGRVGLRIFLPVGIGSGTSCFGAGTSCLLSVVQLG